MAVSSAAAPRRESVVAMPGVTRYSQAIREATERALKLDPGLFCEFTQFDEGWQTQIVDVHHRTPACAERLLVRLPRQLRPPRVDEGAAKARIALPHRDGDSLRDASEVARGHGVTTTRISGPTARPTTA